MHNVISPRTAETDTAAALCSVCGHPESAHDVISTRWCAATALGVGSRACVCSGLVAGARLLTHY
jgi:hypothetical protein